MSSKVNAGFGRREFLVLSSSCAVATLALGPKLFADTFARPRDLAIGVAPIDEIDRARTSLFETRLAPASAITSPDGSFLRNGARVRFAGSAVTDTQRTIGFRSHYLVDDNDIAVESWGFNRSTGVGSGRSEYAMPIEVEQRLRFSLVVQDTDARRRGVAAPQPETTPSVVLSLLDEPDTTKLARAYYVIVPLHDGASAPRWNELTLHNHQGNMLMHEMRDGLVQPVEREHFVLRVDYAKPGF